MGEQLRLPGDSDQFSIPYEKLLNPAQFTAVTTTSGPLLVIAGAGSGKTRTLTYRVARLVEAGVEPGSILLLTFTRKASQEMLKRAADLLDSRCNKVSGGTFHSFANYILHRFAHIIGFGNGFSIIDRADSESLINIIRKEMGFGNKNHSFPRKKTLINIFSRAINKAIAVEDIIYDDYFQFRPAMEEICTLAREYKKRKVEHRFMDYDDLLVYLLAILKNHPSIREELSNKYQYIMVDEYQDTNLIQSEIVSLLASEHHNIMVVGDDSQSIYSFRGANYKNIINFPQNFPGTKIIKLEENYRSTQTILNLTNIIIERAADKYSKTLFSQNKLGQVPLLALTDNENSQSRWIVKKIQQLQKKGVKLNKIAVLFRASFHSFDLEIELGRKAMPFIKVGGFKFMEAAHIKDVLSHLKILVSGLDKISWYRILLLLNKIGPKTAEKIYQSLSEAGGGLNGFLTYCGSHKIAPVLISLKELLQSIDPDIMTVDQLGAAVINYYTPILQARYDNYPKRMKDLEHLLTIMERYDSLDQFLTDMALEPPNTSMNKSMVVDAAGEQNGKLTLSTIHSAKGLEWHTVFIIWALDGRFPSVHSFYDDETMEEELRLMYVAATRACSNLYFSCPCQVYDRGADMFLNQPSRFIDDLPKDVLKISYI